MIDNYVKVIYGWKIPSTDVDKVKDQLGEEIDDALDKFMVYDFGQGLFLYIGAIIGEFNCDEDDAGEILVTSKIAGPKISKFNAFIENNKDIKKVFKKYMRKQAQLYVVQQKW